MSDEHRDPAPERRSRPSRRTVGMGVLAVALVGLLVYLVLPGASGPRGLAACAGRGAPQVGHLAPRELSPLRESVARVLPQRVGRLYEEGTVTAASAWSDEQPAPPAVSPTARRPAGYEMRWWAPNGDDIAADVYVFSNPQTAQRFLRLAAGASCRRSAHQGVAPHPPLSRNLTWLNPDGAAEADVYLARGSRVYRVADAPSGQRSARHRSGFVARALYTIDTLACLLPEAHCSAGSRSVPA